MKTRLISIILAAALSVALYGCPGNMPTLPDVPQQATTPAQQQIAEVKKQLNDVRAWAVSTARTVAPNVRDGIWSPDFGETILNQTDDIMARLDDADSYLALGDIVSAKDRHATARQIMIAAKREIAQQGAQ